MPNTAKQEAIRKAYGEYWDKLDELSQQNALVEDGWLDFEVIRESGLVELFFNGRISTYIYHIPLENDTIDRDFYRPKSLQGIETNNNWIRIDSEDDLPLLEDESEFWIANENGIFDFTAYSLQVQRKWENKTLTHYHRVVKPVGPIY